MARKKRKMPGVNTSSTADIAFILLIFFLTATSMNTDKGLARKLPPPVPEELKNAELNIKERNMLRVRISSQNELLCQDEEIDVSELKDITKDFIKNENNEDDKPTKVLMKIPGLGEFEVTKNHVLSLQCDNGTKYSKYLEVQNELVAAYNELREEFSKKKWGKSFEELEEDKKTAVRKLYPQKISEAEPKQYGGKK